MDDDRNEGEYGSRNDSFRGRGGGGGMGRHDDFLPKPVKVGDEAEVDVISVASKGDGIAKKDGFVIFIKGAKEGDKVKVRITDVKARFAVGEIIS